MKNLVHLLLLLSVSFLAGCQPPPDRLSSNSGLSNGATTDSEVQEGNQSDASENLEKIRSAEEAVLQLIEQMNKIAGAVDSGKSRIAVNQMVDVMASINEKLASFPEPERLAAMAKHSAAHSAATSRYQTVVKNLSEGRLVISPSVFELRPG